MRVTAAQLLMIFLYLLMISLYGRVRAAAAPKIPTDRPTRSVGIIGLKKDLVTGFQDEIAIVR